jgi:hypothetical protein
MVSFTMSKTAQSTCQKTQRSVGINIQKYDWFNILNPKLKEAHYCIKIGVKKKEIKKIVMNNNLLNCF